MSDSSCRQKVSAGDDPSLIYLSMDFNSDVVQRRQWSSTPTTSADTFPSQSVQTSSSGPAMSVTTINSAPSDSSLAVSAQSFPMNLWAVAPPTSSVNHYSLHRSASIHRGMRPHSYGAEYPNPASWNTYDVQVPQQYHSAYQQPEKPSHDMMHHGHIGSSMFYGRNIQYGIDPNAGVSQGKSAEGTIAFPSLETDFSAYGSDFATHDENNSIVELGKGPPGLDEPLSLDTAFSRRLSESSFSMASTAGTTDMNDLSAFSEVPSYSSEYTPRSSLNLSTSALSPVPSPRFPQQENVRSGSRGRASPSPRTNYRLTPYSFDPARTKRWSTGSYAPASVRRTTPYVFGLPEGGFPPGTDSPTYTLPVATSNIASQNLVRANNINGAVPRFHRNSMLLPSFFDPMSFPNSRATPTTPMPSNTFFRTLQSNASPRASHVDPYSSFSAPPDLFGPLASRPASPPPEDMDPPSPTMKPHEQDLRFTGDLYTPKYVRGHGNKREGWCGICKPGRWLVLKNSAFWYDKSFTHGISAATGMPFEGPRETRRMEGNSEVWEGLCGCCGEWVALVSSKKKGTTWFRHAYKCHAHARNKEAPKRRRELSQTNIQFDCSSHDHSHGHGHDQPNSKMARLSGPRGAPSELSAQPSLSLSSITAEGEINNIYPGINASKGTSSLSGLGNVI